MCSNQDKYNTLLGFSDSTNIISNKRAGMQRTFLVNEDVSDTRNNGCHDRGGG